MKKIIFLFLVFFSFLSFNLVEKAKAQLIESSLELSGNLVLQYKDGQGNYLSQVIEGNSDFSGTDPNSLSFSTVGDLTGRTFDSTINLSLLGGVHTIDIDFTVSPVDSSIFIYSYMNYGLGFNFGAYATLTFYSETDESVTFKKEHSGISLWELDHSYLTDPDYKHSDINIYNIAS